MKKIIAALAALVLFLAALLSACAPAGGPAAPTASPGTAEPAPASAGASEKAAPAGPDGPAAADSTGAPGTTAPAGMPARPGSGATGDPSGRLADLVELSGTVREVREGLVLIETDKGGEYMLRFSGNSKWADGVGTEIETGNRITCRVRPEPTLTTPAQGEVFEVTENKKN